jgi:hypothetical protein
VGNGEEVEELRKSAGRRKSEEGRKAKKGEMLP